jgi:hypothetical protein
MSLASPYARGQLLTLQPLDRPTHRAFAMIDAISPNGDLALLQPGKRTRLAFARRTGSEPFLLRLGPEREVFRVLRIDAK